jgi:hypothetical protein
MGPYTLKRMARIVGKGSPLRRGAAVYVYGLLGFLVLAKLLGGHFQFFNRLGYYTVFLLLWGISTILVSYGIIVAWEVFQGILVLLFVFGLYMFSQGHDVYGSIFTGTVGGIILFITLMGVLALMSVLIPGALAGGATYLYIDLKSGEEGIGIVAGIIVFLVVSALLYELVFKIIRPFALGFSISLVSAGIASSIASSIFFARDAFNLPNPGGLGLYYRITDLRGLFYVLERVVYFLKDYLASLWAEKTVIFIVSCIYGLYMIGAVHEREEETRG